MYVGAEANIGQVAKDLRNLAPTVLIVCSSDEDAAARMVSGTLDLLAPLPERGFWSGHFDAILISNLYPPPTQEVTEALVAQERPLELLYFVARESLPNTFLGSICGSVVS